MTLSETLTAGLNNPDCAFFVGQFFGTTLIVKIALYLVVMYWIATAAQRLAFDPFIDWVKKRFKKSKL